MKKVLFIINPVSGVGRQKKVEKHLSKYDDFFVYDIKYTKAPKHAIELSKNASSKYDIVIAVGGDGSVNEVGQGLINTNTALGIIPTGSGNGLARFLKLPLKIPQALDVIKKTNIKKIDTIIANNMFCLNITGIGFDALISHKFAKYGKRGFSSYLKIVISEYQKYKTQNYDIEIDGKKYTKNAFLISFANSSQFGNNAHISPMAIIDDGLIDISFLKKFPYLAMFNIGIRLFAKNIHKSKYNEIIRAKQIEINGVNKLIGHIDGEPVDFGKNLKIKIIPKSLNVIVP